MHEALVLPHTQVPLSSELEHVFTNCLLFGSQSVIVPHLHVPPSHRGSQAGHSPLLVQATHVDVSHFGIDPLHVGLLPHLHCPATSSHVFAESE